MLLIVTGRADATATYLTERLGAAGIDYCRLNTDVLTTSVRVGYRNAKPTLRVDARLIVPDEISLVVLRRPRPLVAPPDVVDPAERRFMEMEAAEALEGFLAHVPFSKWMNHPSANAGASHKIEQLSRARAFNLAVPPTLVTDDPSELRQFFTACRGQMIVKPMSSGVLERSTGEDTVIYTSSVDEDDLELPSTLAGCPCLAQEKVDKTLDIRVTAVDRRLQAVAIHHIQGGKQVLDVRRDCMASAVYEPYELPDQTRSALHSLVASYSLRFAAIDLGLSSTGDLLFFEINPNGQWAWLDIHGSTGISNLFVKAYQDCPCGNG